MTRLVEAHRNRPRDEQHDTGLILVERTLEHPQPSLRPRVLPSPVASSEASKETTDGMSVHPPPTQRIGLAMLLGALLGGGIVGLFWFLSQAG